MTLDPESMLRIYHSDRINGFRMKSYALRQVNIKVALYNSFYKDVGRFFVYLIHKIIHAKKRISVSLLIELVCF